MNEWRPTEPPTKMPTATGPAEEKAYCDLTLEQAARKTPPTGLTDSEVLIDLPKMRRYRLARIRAELRKQDLAGCVLLVPHSIRYATGIRNCAIYQTHILAGYLFIATDGPVVLFDSQPGRFRAQDLETIDECRHDVLPLSFMWASTRLDEWMDRWAAQMADLVEAHGGGNRRLAIERAGPRAPAALAKYKVEVFDAGDVVEPARAIKSPEEVLCLNHVIAVAEEGLFRMREALKPGVTELEVWSKLWEANIVAGGDFAECRLLSSGDRTNPWQQEASSRKIRAGDLLGVDTDMVGPFGYFADISRVFFCEPGKPSAEQKDIYRRAHEEIHANLELMQPGMTFREITQKAFRQPEEFRPQRYPVLAHGCGMSDEWPCVYYPEDDHFSYDGQLEPGMVMSVESYVGAVGGHEGVKLEEMLLITKGGHIKLSSFPFEESLLG